MRFDRRYTTAYEWRFKSLRQRSVVVRNRKLSKRPRRNYLCARGEIGRTGPFKIPHVCLDPRLSADIPKKLAASSRFIFHETSARASDERKETHTYRGLVVRFPPVVSSDSFHYRVGRTRTLFEEDMGRPIPFGIEGTPFSPWWLSR